MDLPPRVWYVAVIATVYLILCSCSSLLCASQFFQPGRIHSSRELLALGSAIAGGFYFFRPTWGHKGLLALTIVVLLAIGESDPEATMFHLTILVLLLLPFFTRQSKDRQALQDTHATMVAKQFHSQS